VKTICKGCRQEFSVDDWRSDPHFPFCGERCKMADLDRWFTEEHRIVDDAAVSEED
jgi:endogenous inhibitor of DNA gyrase (YacG/DUF329 family)